MTSFGAIIFRCISLCQVLRVLWGAGILSFGGIISFPHLVGKVIVTSIKKLFSSLLGYRCLWIIFLHLICGLSFFVFCPHESTNLL
ncbi:hypothetical protein EYC84_008266 [Monilinia fructicola]|uniref:Uncharacterized protein n=1 Tax=Monilinia fructicola TaxID=38448 RepID=A0A5M9JES7_MONFR|nr:hypothetical protein EYC84_008266 [Monilinia fructicola]